MTGFKEIRRRRQSVVLKTSFFLRQSRTELTRGGFGVPTHSMFCGPFWFQLAEWQLFLPNPDCERVGVAAAMQVVGLIALLSLQARISESLKYFH